MTLRPGDIVAMSEAEMRPRLKANACTVEELSALKIIAVKMTGAGLVAKLCTKRGAGVGWAKARELTFVRRGEE